MLNRTILLPTSNFGSTDYQTIVFHQGIAVRSIEVPQLDIGALSYALPLNA